MFVLAQTRRKNAEYMDLTAMTYSEAYDLSRMELFTGLAPDGLEAIRASARMVSVDKDELIFEQGAAAKHAYALAEGSIRIVQTGSDGRQAIIRFIAPGEMFGTVPLFTNHIFPADAVAAEPSSVVSWSEADILALIERHPRIAMNVAKIIGNRLADVQNRVRELATQSTEQRIAHTLVRLAAQADRDAEGNMVLHIPLRRKDIAEASGTTLHTVSRTLSVWQKAGLLESHEQRVTIQDLGAITCIANSD